MKTIHYYFTFIKAVAIVTYKEWGAYRSHMLVSLIVGPVNFFVQLFIWQAIFKNSETINGFTLQQMIAYYGTVTVVNFLTMDFADWNLQMLIHTGKFTGFIIRPLSHQLFALSQKIGHRILGFFWEFIPVYIIICLIIGSPLLPASLLTPLSIVLGFLMSFFINYSVGILGFWLTRAEGVRRMILVFGMVLNGTFLPLSFFPDVLQKVLFVLPFQFATYVPIRVFLGSYELAGIKLSSAYIVTIQAIAVIAMFVFSRILMHAGLKRYTGVGI